MAILFILVGAFIGGIAASAALMGGASLLVALVFYSIFGTLGGLVVALALFLYREAAGKPDQWAGGQKSNDAVSA